MTQKNTVLYIQWGDEGNGIARGIASTWKLLQQQPKPAPLPTPRELATPQIIHVVGLRHRTPVNSQVLQVLLILTLEEQSSLGRLRTDLLNAGIQDQVTILQKFWKAIRNGWPCGEMAGEPLARHYSCWRVLTQLTLSPESQLGGDQLPLHFYRTPVRIGKGRPIAANRPSNI